MDFTVDGFMYKEQKMVHLLLLSVIYMNKYYTTFRDSELSSLIHF